METSLHRQLKALYAPDEDSIEVPLGRYRIDAIRDDELIEIQHGSLSAIRDKVKRLLRKHQVLVVKPIIAKKTLIHLDERGGSEVRRRRSPKRGCTLDLFDELVYFTRVFPHQRLTLEIPLVEVEEVRYPGHGRRRRRRENDFQVEDQMLVKVQEVFRFRSAADLRGLLPRRLPKPFHTGHLAEGLEIKRWVAQRIAYCLRKTGAARQVGKQGNTLMYELTGRARRKKLAS